MCRHHCILLRQCQDMVIIATLLATKVTAGLTGTAALAQPFWWEGALVRKGGARRSQLQFSLGACFAWFWTTRGPLVQSVRRGDQEKSTAIRVMGGERESGRRRVERPCIIIAADPLAVARKVVRVT